MSSKEFCRRTFGGVCIVDCIPDAIIKAAMGAVVRRSGGVSGGVGEGPIPDGGGGAVPRRTKSYLIQL